ncbi:hypothetical protein C8J56DRAFT_862607 [Mycena floridula]|nr:hypothetical protein C8J56DRAFT_862607 [Mycena floridula]
MHSLVVIASIFFSCSVLARLRNITVDDSDVSIIYSTGWSTSDINNPLNFGGFHHLSENRTATATFTFTGVAIYYLAPLWPYPVGAQVAVDSASSILVDMQDYSRSSPDGPETVASAPIFQLTGLKNEPHTLKISFPSEKQYLALDGLIYTVEDADTSRSLSTKFKIGIALGVLAICLIIAGGCLLYIHRKRRDQDSASERMSFGNSGPEMSTVGSQVGMLGPGGITSPAMTIGSRNPSYFSDTRQSSIYSPGHPQMQLHSFPSLPPIATSEFGAIQIQTVYDPQSLYDSPNVPVHSGLEHRSSSYQTVMEYNPNSPERQHVRSIQSGDYPRPESFHSQNAAGIGSGFHRMSSTTYPREKAGYRPAQPASGSSAAEESGPSGSTAVTAPVNDSNARPLEKDTNRMRVINSELPSPGDDAPPKYELN